MSLLKHNTRPIGTNVCRGDGHAKLVHKALCKRNATLLDVTCCVCLHTLLLVVAQNLKPVKRLATCERT